MEALFLIAVYVGLAAAFQAVGFAISEFVEYEWPAAGLMVFLACLIVAYWAAWPLAVRISDKVHPRKAA